MIDCKQLAEDYAKFVPETRVREEKKSEVQASLREALTMNSSTPVYEAACVSCGSATTMSCHECKLLYCDDGNHRLLESREGASTART